MPELTSVPDAQRPIGRFITERVVPQWDSLNEYRFWNRHNRVVNRALGRRALQIRPTGGPSAAFLLNGRVVGGRHGKQTTLVSDQAAEACASKTLTRAYWDVAGIPTMRAEGFSSENAAAAEEYVRATTDPLVMKPDRGRHGAGVTFGLGQDTFDNAWDQAVSANPAAADSGPEVLLEKFQDGLCVRFFVIGGQVCAATLRVPLFIIGDGRCTVRQLLERSFAHQQRHVVLRNTRPEITEELVGPSGLHLDQVPSAGTLHILREDPRLPLGGIPYDVTALVGSELNDLASEAALAIPGLGSAGIDVLAASLDTAEGALALDADSWASLVMHGYPAFGLRRIIGTPLAHQLRLHADHWDRPVYSGSARFAASPDEE